jgi:hypothetical protein
VLVRQYLKVGGGNRDQRDSHHQRKNQTHPKEFHITSPCPLLNQLLHFFCAIWNSLEANDSHPPQIRNAGWNRRALRNRATRRTTRARTFFSTIVANIPTRSLKGV